MSSYGPSEHDLRAAKQALSRRYLRRVGGTFASGASAGRLLVPVPEPLENVVGVGIGDKVTGRELTGERCVKIYVVRKYTRAEIREENRLPTTIEGVVTDIEEVGWIYASQQPCSVGRRRRLDPAPCGVSVGHTHTSAGTIGALVRDSGRRDDGRRYILSNNHVLANSNAAAAGDAIFQPGPIDGGTADANRIGTLARFVPMDLAGGANSVDCALARVEDGAVLSEICAIGAVRGTIRARRNMTVFKHGRTTGLTSGLIRDVDADIRVHYDRGGVSLFLDQIVIRGVPPTTPFSDFGDSGSAIVDDQRRVCGLLFAASGSTDVTYANPIGPVLRTLRIRLP